LDPPGSPKDVLHISVPAAGSEKLPDLIFSSGRTLATWRGKVVKVEVSLEKKNDDGKDGG